MNKYPYSTFDLGFTHIELIDMYSYIMGNTIKFENDIPS